MPSNPDDILTIALLQAEVSSLRSEVKGLTKATQDLIDAWNAAGKLVAFVKWVSSLLVAVSAVYVFMRHGISEPKG